MEPETTWNKAIFDGVTDEQRMAINRAMEDGSISEFEPLPDGPGSFWRLTEDDVIEHAHETRDAFLASLDRQGGNHDQRRHTDKSPEGVLAKSKGCRENEGQGLSHRNMGI